MMSPLFNKMNDKQKSIIDGLVYAIFRDYFGKVKEKMN